MGWNSWSVELQVYWICNTLHIDNIKLDIPFTDQDWGLIPPKFLGLTGISLHWPCPDRRGWFCGNNGFSWQILSAKAGDFMWALHH